MLLIASYSHFATVISHFLYNFLSHYYFEVTLYRNLI
jgi:hypothetical protein